MIISMTKTKVDRTPQKAKVQSLLQQALLSSSPDESVAFVFVNKEVPKIVDQHSEYRCELLTDESCTSVRQYCDESA